MGSRGRTGGGADAAAADLQGSQCVDRPSDPPGGASCDPRCAGAGAQRHVFVDHGDGGDDDDDNKIVKEESVGRAYGIVAGSKSPAV